NFYAEREVIPILSSRVEIESVLSQAPSAYMLVRERDLKSLDLEKRGKSIATHRVGNKEWHLVLMQR
ncbi:MAG: hypothetical protein AAB070_05965, partial [Candidatus Binatota bacterium]